jgi:hypothetical protein
MSNIFSNRDIKPVRKLRYDIKRYESERHVGPVSSYRLDTPASFAFEMDDTQRSLIDRNLAIYGHSPVGIGRIVSKVYVRKLFRHAIQEGDKVAGETELRLRIAGLQN